MKRHCIIIFCALMVMTACGAQKKLASSPEMLQQVDEWTVSGVAYDNGDFSGLAFSADGKRMIAAFNSAALYWLDMPETGKELNFTPFEVPGAKFRETKRDIEAVTVNGNTGDIFYVQERGSREFAGGSLYRLAAPSYNKEELVITFDKETIPDGNNGTEGLTWTDGDNLIVGREGGGHRHIAPLMIFYSCKDGITKKISPAEEIKQIAEVVYDKVRDCLWILDGDYDRILYRCDMEGRVIDRFPIPDIKNAEALLLDREHRCIWIGSDEVPSKLYRIGFNNL
ncbi:MAG: hypothetical protein MJY46_03220 [Bacteroidales bacterium]|nr:hypothetical protein [Bacteroidales bacterium]